METPVGSRATTRSIGNFAYKEYGMCSTPSTEILQLKSGNNEVFVIGSDGLFDGLFREEIHAIVTHPKLIGNGQTASKALLEEALTKSQMRFKSHIVDNISVIVIYVNVKNIV
jgi:serine/threonine protein phosphatase PrpC